MFLDLAWPLYAITKTGDFFGLDLSRHSVFVESLHEQTLILVWILKLCCKTNDTY